MLMIIYTCRHTCHPFLQMTSSYFQLLSLIICRGGGEGEGDGRDGGGGGGVEEEEVVVVEVVVWGVCRLVISVQQQSHVLV